jgi:hypothetical protein
MTACPGSSTTRWLNALACGREVDVLFRAERLIVELDG